MLTIGLDAGSVAVKMVVLDPEGKIVFRANQRHKGRPMQAALALLKQVCLVYAELSLSVTGSAGRLIGKALNILPVNEVVAHAYGTRRLHPGIRTIIELGGEDAKLIFLDEASAAAKDFSMNSVCAAGTGSFLDQQAERLNLTIEEFSELSLRSKKPPRIAGRCSVFAKSDMIHLQQIATPVEDIVAGLCFAVARNFKGSIAKGRALVSPISFQGGVAANKGMVRAFREVLGVDDIFISEDHALIGAIGAALKDMDAGRFNSFALEEFEKYLSASAPTEKGYSPLLEDRDDFRTRHLDNGKRPSDVNALQTGSRDPLRAYLGVDIGSISTNLVVIDEDCNVLAKRYLMTAGRPIEAVKQGLREIGAEIGDNVEITGVGTTGSGRYMIADYIGADIVKNEITAQATAAAFIDKEVDTIFEIGGQDSKYISLKNGVIVDFEMNKACAAGTGSFLEEQAEKLNISVKGEFQEAAFCAGNPCRLGERCTVFMENSLMANLQKGIPKDDLLSGLAYSIVQNYINRVVCKRPIGEKIFFQGGVAFNKAVVAAFEKYLDKKVIVPEHHDVTGAIGMALIAKEHMEGISAAEAETGGGSSPITHHPLPVTAFKGFKVSERPYEISSFECRGCSNVCEINRVKVEGEKDLLYYGGRCDKYDVKRKHDHGGLQDLFAFRDDMLWRSHLASASGNKGPNRRGRIGIPYIFYFHDFLPFWTTLLWKLGFDVEVSPRTERGIIDLGNETILAETCFPVKAAHGHISYLLKKGIRTLFIPSFIDLNSNGSKEREYACPYTQTIPYLARTAFPEAEIISPVVSLSLGRKNLGKELVRRLEQFGVTGREISAAIREADKAQTDFVSTIKEKGREVLSGLRDRALVIVGRAYNSFDRGMNLDIPKKINSLKVQTIPMDFLPLEQHDIKKDWPNMYWRAGRRILSAAKIISSNPLLDAVYIGNFSCGPDSFIIKFFEEELQGKSYLHLELDAHSADAGAITRCEAFLDSIQNRNGDRSAGKARKRPLHLELITKGSGRTIYIPPMVDQTVAVAAAFEYCGLKAEVLPESAKESADLGRRFVSGKECYPCAVTTGDMVRKIMEPGFDPERSAFFMPSGSGPCRFGQYNIFHRMVIRDLGIDNLMVFSPNQNENFYRQLGLAGDEFFLRAWEGVSLAGLLMKCLHQTRPYEKQPGESDHVYAGHLKTVYEVTRNRNGDFIRAADSIRRDFENIPVYREDRPLVGIIGEIFVRLNRFSNEDLVRKIEALGGEAYLTPFEEWINYINLMGHRSALIKKDLSGIITALLKRRFQLKVEHRLAARFKGFLRHIHEPDTKKVLKYAEPYIHDSFEGEAVLSIGKCIDLAERGAAGIVNVMPFGCMPGTIVNALLRGIHNRYGMPVLGIPYDGTESLTTAIQLEAFMDQSKEYMKRR